LPRGDNGFGLHGQIGGAGDEIGLIGFEKAERRREHNRIGGAGPQIGRGQPGDVEQPARAAGFGQRPCQRPECDRERGLPLDLIIVR